MIIGIDPGAKGGIALLHKDKLDLYVMPTWEQKILLSKPKELKGGKIKTHRTEVNISANQLERILIDRVISKGHDRPKVYVEDIKDIYGISSQANFKMGYNLGMVHSLLDRTFSEYFLVRPQLWQKEIWIESDIIKKPNKRNDTKKTSLNAAMRIFPEESFIAPNGKTPHDGLFDAALIAHYGELHAKT